MANENTLLDKMRGVGMIVGQEPAGGSESTREMQARAFLSLMHPELSLKERKQMAREIAREDE